MFIEVLKLHKDLRSLKAVGLTSRYTQYAYICTNMFIYTCLYIYICVCLCMYTHTYTYIQLALKIDNINNKIDFRRWVGISSNNNSVITLGRGKKVSFPWRYPCIGNASGYCTRHISFDSDSFSIVLRFYITKNGHRIKLILNFQICT